MKAYRTIDKQAEAVLIERKSRFIGRCFPVESEAEATFQLNAIKKQFHDATHNCHAFIVGENGMISRCSDDGEPSGTAGVPILEVLKAKQLTNVLCGVTRYFGGILLGAGGLVRAYSKSASLAIEASGIVEISPGLLMITTTDYSRYGQLEGPIRKLSTIESIDFTDVVTITSSLPAENADDFIKQIIEASDGRVMPKIGSEITLRRLI